MRRALCDAQAHTQAHNHTEYGRKTVNTGGWVAACATQGDDRIGKITFIRVTITISRDGHAHCRAYPAWWQRTTDLVAVRTTTNPRTHPGLAAARFVLGVLGRTVGYIKLPTEELNQLMYHHHPPTTAPYRSWPVARNIPHLSTVM